MSPTRGGDGWSTVGSRHRGGSGPSSPRRGAKVRNLSIECNEGRVDVGHFRLVPFLVFCVSRVSVVDRVTFVTW